MTESWSASAGGKRLGLRFEEDLCSPPVVVLPPLARRGGGRIEALLVMLPVALGGRDVVIVDVLRVGLVGSRLGD